MPRKSADEGTAEVANQQEAWDAQDPCPECGGRPGYNPATGVELRTGHSYVCSKRPQ